MDQLQNIKNQIEEMYECCAEIDKLHEKYLKFPKRRSKNYPFFSDKLTGWLFLEEIV